MMDEGVHEHLPYVFDVRWDEDGVAWLNPAEIADFLNFAADLCPPSFEARADALRTVAVTMKAVSESDPPER